MSRSSSSTDGGSSRGDLLEVGRIRRAHGIRGDVVVALVTDRTERLTPGRHLVLADGSTLEVRAAQPHGTGHLVTFVELTDRAGAEALAGQPLYAEPLEEPGELWVHELVGAGVQELDGTVRGTVVAVQANPASDLLVLDSGALVPVRFVVSHEPGRLVVVDVPAGLFEL